MTLDEAHAHIGHGVVYRPAHAPAEDGVIVRVNDQWAFVRYGGHGIKATDPARLELLSRPG